MTIQLEVWHLILMAIAWFGAVWAFGKVLLDQFEKRVSEQNSSLTQLITSNAESQKNTSKALTDLERDFLKWQADMPIHYVRREDYVRGQSVIEAKLDALYSKLEVVQMKGINNG